MNCLLYSLGGGSTRVDARPDERRDAGEEAEKERLTVEAS